MAPTLPGSRIVCGTAASIAPGGEIGGTVPATGRRLKCIALIAGIERARVVTARKGPPRGGVGGP